MSQVDEGGKRKVLFLLKLGRGCADSDDPDRSDSSVLKVAL